MYITVITLLVSHERGIWCHIERFTLLRVLRKILEHKGEELTEDRRKLHNEKLLTIYDAGDQIKKIEMGGT
jgi:hypothetical protein